MMNESFEKVMNNKSDLETNIPPDKTLQRTPAPALRAVIPLNSSRKAAEKGLENGNHISNILFGHYPVIGVRDI